MVVTAHKGRPLWTVRGPETKATAIDCPAEGEWLGIRFRLGILHGPSCPWRPARSTRREFARSDWSIILVEWLAWEYPDFENAEAICSAPREAPACSHVIAPWKTLCGRVFGIVYPVSAAAFSAAHGMTHSTFAKSSALDMRRIS